MMKLKVWAEGPVQEYSKRSNCSSKGLISMEAIAVVIKLLFAAFFPVGCFFPLFMWIDRKHSKGWALGWLTYFLFMLWMIFYAGV